MSRPDDTFLKLMLFFGKLRSIRKNVIHIFWESISEKMQQMDTPGRGFFGPFWRPIFGRVPNAKKYVFSQFE